MLRFGRYNCARTDARGRLTRGTRLLTDALACGTLIDLGADTVRRDIARGRVSIVPATHADELGLIGAPPLVRLALFEPLEAAQAELASAATA